ncbi:MAG: T9SS type A sorting domain-containing protein [Ignavibacteriae bacterium]|nr:T9SS type A sorting domain-containing protein [Ignavibacteriota bacterium]
MKKIIFIAFFVLLIPAVLFPQWVQLQSGTTLDLNDICFVNPSTGIAVGSNGKLIRTTNGGLNWTAIPLTTTQNILSTCFPAIETGYISGYTGFVLKTTNSGGNWISTSGCGINVFCISFLNANTGITGGSGTGGLMCHTTDGGLTFSPRYIPAPYLIFGMHYFSPSLLLVCGTDLGGAVIYKSTNSGNSFNVGLMLNNNDLTVMYALNSVFFKNSNTGFATGSRTVNGANYADIYRSTNSGDSWNLHFNIGPDSGVSFNSVHFSDSLNGFAAGSKGKIVRSTNGGDNWIVQNTGTSSTLNQIFMVNALTGYVCGNGGIILKTTNGGITGFRPIGENISDKYELHQNYPNPFNPSTIIRFQIKEKSYVSLKIFDVLGKEIETLVNEYLNPGTYEIPFSIFHFNDYQNPSGIYFYKLIAGDFSETKKMMLIK